MSAKAYIDLKTLPEEHPLRNTPLDKIGAEFKHQAWDAFRPIEQGRPLANDTYNTLEGPWPIFFDWRAPT